MGMDGMVLVVMDRHRLLWVRQIFFPRSFVRSLARFVTFLVLVWCFVGSYGGDSHHGGGGGGHSPIPKSKSPAVSAKPKKKNMSVVNPRTKK